MENLKIVNRITSLSGIVLVVFAIFSAFITYELIQENYGSLAPARYIQFSILASMLPYLVAAVIAFVISGVSSRATAEPVETMHPEQTEPQPA